jgi:hypothetical protein
MAFSWPVASLDFSSLEASIQPLMQAQKPKSIAAA